MSIKITLTKEQYRYFASSLKTIAEGIMLGDLAAFFLPETLQTGKAITLIRFILFAIVGLLFLIFGAIFIKRGER